MGRPPCCEKAGLKKGPWSPEEDLLLVSYVQEHGPGNWRAVPCCTGLMRCSKSCRLRWTNYLRPGIKRDSFSDQEEKLIIHLQELLGNKWSAIASYLPERTDNDIKNYWNTHLKKKLAKTGAREGGASAKTTKSDKAAAPKGQWERRLQTNIHTARQALREALSMDTATPVIKPEPLPQAQLPAPASQAMYASSIDNIARLLEGWMRPSVSGNASAESMSSLSAFSGGGEGASASHIGTAHTPEGFTGTRKEEGAGPGPGPGPSSLPMLESWLLDDGMGNGDGSLICVPLADPCEFF